MGPRIEILLHSPDIRGEQQCPCAVASTFDLSATCGSQEEPPWIDPPAVS